MINKKPEIEYVNDEIAMYYAGDVDDYYNELLIELQIDYLFRKKHFPMSISSKIQSIAKELGWDNE